MSANTIDGVVVTNTVRNDANISIPLAAVHASYGTIEFTWQKTVDESDRLRLMQAAMSQSNRLMGALNGTLSLLMQKDWSQNTSPADAFSLSQGLEMANVDRGTNPDYFRFLWTDPANGIENEGYVDGITKGLSTLNGVEVTDLVVQGGKLYYIPRRTGTLEEMTLPFFYRDSSNVLRYAASITDYKGVVSAYKSGEIVPSPPISIIGDKAPSDAVPGQYLKSDNGNYYRVTAQKDANGGYQAILTAPPTAEFIGFPLTASQESVDSWKRLVRSVNDDLGQASITQMSVQQEVSGKLQSMTTLLTNLLQRMETLLTAISGRVS